MRDFEKALAIYPGNGTHWDNLACARARAEDVTGAIDHGVAAQVERQQQRRGQQQRDHDATPSD